MNTRESKFPVPNHSQNDSLRETLTADVPAIEKALDGLIANTKHLAKDVAEVDSQEKEAIRDSMMRILAGFGIHNRTFLEGLFYSEPGGCGIVLNVKDEEEVGLPSIAHFATNVWRMISLEKRCRGSVNYLHSRRGIRNFARYSVAFWERQYAERDSDLPYMVIVNPCDLENDYLSQTEVYLSLQNTLAALSAPHLVRMVEVMDVPDMLRRFVELTKTYNENGNNPIAAVLYDGHGTAERVLIRRGRPGGLFGPTQLTTKEFAEVFKTHLSKAFAKSAQFLLGSCEAGRKDYYEPAIGFVFKDVMQQVHDLNVRVSASPYSILPFTSIGASLKDGVLSLVARTRYQDRKTLRIRRHQLEDL